jgi:hypothetical protein
MRPPRSKTWGRRGITPVIWVRGGTGHVSIAGLACYRPGPPEPPDLPAHRYRGRKGETKAFTWTEYRDLLIAAHRQLPGGTIVLVWDKLSVHLRAEGIWPVLKRGALANLAVASFAHLVQVIRHGLKKIQYQPRLIDGCLAGTGLALQPY